ncbi:MAG: hypothetical protein WBG48_08860 [Pricia sp.]
MKLLTHTPQATLITIPFVNLLHAVFQFDGVVPPQIVQFTDIGQFLEVAIGLIGVEEKLTFEIT